MRIIKTDLFKKLIAENGKQIRNVNDVYKEAYIDENGNAIEEHCPSYSETIFLPLNVRNDEIFEMYVEE